MKKNYLMLVNSLSSTFSIIETGKQILFQFETQASSVILSSLNEEDCILGYVGEPINQVRYLFTVNSKVSAYKILLTKTAEVADGVTIDLFLSQKLADSEFVEITDEQYANICRALFDNFSFTQDIEQKIYEFNTSKGGAQNRVVYGTPGCGKSYYVQNKYLNKIGVSKENRIRTTFYQDYTNTDFVGQILPKIVRAQNDNEKDEVTYEFTPGPFALALKMAIEHSDKYVALIIEELNRGNAASIFGDIFQLLDRDENGKSQYSITNTNLQDYLTKEFAEKGYIFDSISIPANLYIVATMNTSDQNVFTLDTAFKRRWQFEKLRNKFTDDHKYKDYTIPGMEDMTWKQLVTDINAFIVNRADDLASEDKQLGVYFIAKENLYAPREEANEEKVKTFAYKLFEYLWDDVAKFSRVDWFGDIKTLDDLIDKYIKEGKKVFVDGIIQQNN